MFGWTLPMRRRVCRRRAKRRGRRIEIRGIAAGRNTRLKKGVHRFESQMDARIGKRQCCSLTAILHFPEDDWFVGFREESHPPRENLGFGDGTPNSSKCLTNCPKISQDVPECPKMSTSDTSLSEWTCFKLVYHSLALVIVRPLEVFNIQRKKAQNRRSMLY